jgi:hypothetical protein
MSLTHLLAYRGLKSNSNKRVIPASEKINWHVVGVRRLEATGSHLWVDSKAFRRPADRVDNLQGLPATRYAAHSTPVGHRFQVGQWAELYNCQVARGAARREKGYLSLDSDVLSLIP